ncbi:MAG TPA: alpha/beta hydrolase [Salinivirgaceae bacterium]|nr:alpha/beta hydrolase [Salinivirgaceae bacterium]
MPYIDIRGKNLYYSVSGEGPVMVFLHGCGRSSKVFGMELQKYTTFCRVIAFDLPGHGLSSEIHLKNELYWEQSAEIIAQALQKLNIEHFFVVGIRDGAIIGLLLAKILFDKITGVFCDSFDGNEITPEQAIRTVRHRKRIQRFFLFRLFESFTMGENWKKILSEDNQRLLWFVRHRRFFFDQPLEISCPVTFTCSLKDEEIPTIIEKMNRMKQIVPNANTIFFEGGKHPSFLSNNQEYLEIIHQFVKNLK